MATCPKCHAEVPDVAKFCGQCAAAMPNKDAGSLIGKRINNKYVVTKKLAEGGMGEVYLAKQEALGQKVAIKKLHASLCRDPKLVDRFITEAQAYGKISHPNAVKVHDLLNVNGELCIIMEYVEGKTLTSYIDHGTIFTQRQILDIGIQIADALATAHKAGIIHRDLKTENIMLLESVAGKYSAKILDFGIAKVSDAPTDGRTSEGVLLGTPEFMSPEQCYGTKVDARSDIYSFGILLYVMISNRLPFRADTKIALIGQQINAEPPALTRLNNQPVPETLEAIVMKCMQKKPDNRYQSFADVITDMTHLQDGEPLEIAQLLRASEPKDSVAAAKTVAKSQEDMLKFDEDDTSATEENSVIEDPDDDATTVYEKPEISDKQKSIKADSVHEEKLTLGSPSSLDAIADSPKLSAGTKKKADDSDVFVIGGETPKASGVYSVGKLKDEKDDGIRGFSIGDLDDDDDDDDNDEETSKSGHKGAIFIVILLILGLAAAYAWFAPEYNLPGAEKIAELTAPIREKIQPTPAEPVAEEKPAAVAENAQNAAVEAAVPTETDTPEPVAQPTPEPEPVIEEPVIPASKVASRDVLMRGVWRTALDMVPESLNAGELDKAKSRLANVSANKIGFTAADDQRLASYQEMFNTFSGNLDSANKALKSMSCGTITSIIETVPEEAVGFRAKLDKMQKNCTRTAEAPPTML